MCTPGTKKYMGTGIILNETMVKEEYQPGINLEIGKYEVIY